MGSRGGVPVDRRLLETMVDMLMTSQGAGVNERPNLRDSDVQKRTLDANREALRRGHTGLVDVCHNMWCH